MQGPFRVGLIGCGLRGVWYLHTFRKAGMPFSLVAVADPDARYARLNDVVCVCVGEVRSTPGRDSTNLVLDVAELVWAPIAD